MLTYSVLDLLTWGLVSLLVHLKWADPLQGVSAAASRIARYRGLLWDSAGEEPGSNLASVDTFKILGGLLTAACITVHNGLTLYSVKLARYFFTAACSSIFEWGSIAMADCCCGSVSVYVQLPFLDLFLLSMIFKALYCMWNNVLEPYRLSEAGAEEAVPLSEPF
jgi:hypothetical protein